MGEFQAILDIQYFDMPHPAALLGQLPDPGGGSHAGEPKIFFLETVRQSGPPDLGFWPVLAKFNLIYCPPMLVAQMVKSLPAIQETRIQSLGWEESLEKEMATHSYILAWEIPWTQEPGGWQSMGLQRVNMTKWLTL